MMGDVASQTQLASMLSRTSERASEFLFLDLPITPDVLHSSGRERQHQGKSST